MITERAKLIFSCLGASLLLAWLTQFELIYFICAVLAGIAAISFLIFKFTLIDVTCSRKLPQAAYEDEIIMVKVVLKNRSIFPNFFIYLTDNFAADQEDKREKKTLLYFLGKRSVVSWQYEGTCFKRGEYWIGPFILIGSDPLGLFKKYKIINISSRLTVYPKIFPIRNLPPFLKGMITPRYGSQTIRKSGDYEEFYSIREYRQEDGLRKIHWPSSAKHNQLMVRHFEQSGSQQVTIALDLNKESNLGKGKETTLEYAVKIAASLSKYFLDRGAVVRILGWSDKPVITLQGHESSHFFIILETLAKLEANGYYSLDKALMQLNPFIPPNSTLIVIALDRDQQILQSIESFIYTLNVSLIDVLLMTSSFAQGIPISPLYSPQVKSQDIKVYHIKCKENLEISFSA
ncbi:MAG: DUF58 domain-containing protein [Candidatus Omnitrophota bacterium]|jgi:uncharacterized protein (DUF58 family)